jgi:glycosyltransferase involved in cell wall biosynthesis
MAKRICFLDDSADYDGFSPTSRPLDGPQKAVAYLAASLAQRGNSVTVVTRAAMPLTCDGVAYPGWDGDKPAEVDLLVAVGDASLFDLVKNANRRVLWVPGDPAAMDAPSRQGVLQRLRPEIVFHTDAQRDRWSNTHGLPGHVVTDAPGHSYLEPIVDEPGEPPHALTVCHPLGGLAAIVDVWVRHVHPAAPSAELHVYSTLLDKAALSGLVSPDLLAIHEKVQAAAAQGIRVKRPQPDPQMAEIYRRARAFLNPGQINEAMALQLIEAQAAGLPAVSYVTGPVARERILNSRTGRLCADDAEFADATLRLLTGDEPFREMAATCREWQRGRSWAIAAADWEERFA